MCPEFWKLLYKDCRRNLKPPFIERHVTCLILKGKFKSMRYPSSSLFKNCLFSCVGFLTCANSTSKAMEEIIKIENFSR